MHDHCHITGKYRVPAHQVCNLNYKIDPTRWKIPVVIHNLRGYDSHLIIQALEEKHDSINIIPSNMEKYISFSINRLRFIDSFQFMNQSLKELVETLNDDDFINLREHFPDQFDLIR